MEIEASSNGIKHNEKIEKVLNKLLVPNFKIKNDVYLNLFLTHLVGKEDNGKIWQKDKELQEQFCQWVIKASTLWDQQKVDPPAAILSFTLNLASHLSTDEQIFVKWNCQNVCESLIRVSQKNRTKDPSVTLGLVTLLCSFLEHKNGLLWVVATTHWTDMINLGLEAHTMYIRKKANQFVVKLLEKAISFNRNFADYLVRILIKPLNDALKSLPSDKNTQHTGIESNDLFESLKPSLELILEVVEKELRTYNKEVLQLFIEQETPETIGKLLLLSQSQEFSFRLLQIKFVFHFLHLCEKVNGQKVLAHDSLLLFNCKIMFDHIKYEMDKNWVICVIKICDYAHELFGCLAPRMPIFTKKGLKIEFQMQVIFLQLMPIFGFSSQLLTEKKLMSLLLNDVFRNHYFNRWLKLSAVQGIEICYKWVEILQHKHDLVDDVIFCLHSIAKMKKLLNKERCATVFSACVFSLTDALCCLKETPAIEISSSLAVYFRTVVDTIVDLVESFDLTWKDSMETIRVMDLACDFLQYPYWPDNIFVIKGLKLLNTAISKYMSPDMALLIYNTDDSKVSQTGSLLYAKCHDSCWEIRDSALEVVHTLSLNAITKFPAYKTILLNSELPHLVVNMALKDGEYYVRATAFRCLQELIQIPEIWDKLLSIDKFVDNILDVFENETEGIVRKEAATLIHKIDKLQNFPEDILPRVYDVMTHAATGDLHWEVKYNALDFWFNLWEQHLIQQGMIDHTFPSHTFSKEHKKIVALNQTEIRKRIIKVLNQLSQIGCLHVMKCAIQDDCDIEVSKKATFFTFSMLKMLKLYQVPSDNVDLSEPTSPAIHQHNLANQQFFNQSPVSLPKPSGPSSVGSGNLGGSEDSLQFTNSPFFEPVSPIPAPLSPSLDLAILTPSSTISPTSLHSSERSRSPHRNSIHQQQVPVQDYNSSRSPFSDPPSNPISSSLNVANGIEMFDYEEDNNFDAKQLESKFNSNGYDPVQAEQALDEFLNSNDMTLLQRIYNPADQVTNNTTQMKKKAYLAPSEYLKFVYNEVETHTMEKTQWLNKLDEFDSLLDDILKEYNVVENVNSMDCY